MLWTLAILTALVMGLYAGYKIGFAVRDYQAAKATIARDAELETTNAELQKLRLKLAVINADLANLVKGAEKQLGIDGWPRPSEGD